MRWEQKAVLQGLIARLPSGLSYRLYYEVQKRFGRLRLAGPVECLTAGVRFVRYLQKIGRCVEGSSVLELGTGRQLNLPLILWMAGAGHILTVDKNPYLKEEMVLQDLAFMRRNRDQVLQILGELAGSGDNVRRMDELLCFDGGLEELLQMTNIEYRAPADASALGLPARSVDSFMSFSVFQHIPPGILRSILVEGRRILRGGGAMLAYVNMTDHFAHDDASISLVNFLRFSDTAWDRLAGNRYMYQNRLRIDDVIRLFGEAGYIVSAVDAKVDERSLRELERGFPVDARFAGKSAGVNATSGAWILAHPCVEAAVPPASEEAETLCALLAASGTRTFHYFRPTGAT